MAVQLDILAVIGFSSDRKRMSILLREICIEGHFSLPENFVRPGAAFVVTKGADNVMLPLCTSFDGAAAVQMAVDELSNRGLRTLVFGMRELDDEWLGEWSREWYIAKNDPETSQRYTDLASAVETGLHFVAVSAVEDKLQDGV